MMITLKKVWVFLKTHWYIPLLIIVGIVVKSKSDALKDIIDAQKKSYDKQTEAIRDAEIEKKNLKEKVEKEYEQAVSDIKLIHKLKKQELAEEKEEEIKKIIKKNYNKPEKITKELSDAFGVKYVPKNLNNNN
jgi:Na+-transporting NADH:ubiquinone oxidoreductase subunit NqrC